MLVLLLHVLDLHISLLRYLRKAHRSRSSAMMPSLLRVFTTHLQCPSSNTKHNSHDLRDHGRNSRSTSEHRHTAGTRSSYSASTSRAPRSGHRGASRSTARADTASGRSRNGSIACARRSKEAVAQTIVAGVVRALRVAGACSVEVSTARDQTGVAGPALHAGDALALSGERIALSAERERARSGGDGGRRTGLEAAGAG